MSGEDRRGGRNHGRADELDRFARFLRSAAAGYHAPPPPPRDRLWASIEAGVEAGLAVDEDPFVDATAAYNEPPSPRRDEMWERIEAGWSGTGHMVGQQSSAGGEEPSAGGETRAGEGTRTAPAAGTVRTIEDLRRRKRVVPVVGVLAIAASLLIGIAIGRRSAEQLVPGAEGPVALGPGPGEAVAPPPAVETIEPSPLLPETLETAGRPSLAVDPVRGPESGGPVPRPSGGPAAEPLTGGEPGGISGAASRRATAVRYATLEHFGRAETLLTSVRATAASPGDLVDLGAWAGRLLAETRLLLDLSVERDPRETGLLEELELVLARIAAGAAGSPADREVLADGLDRTLPRLRAIAPGGAAGLQVGT